MIVVVKIFILEPDITKFNNFERTQFQPISARFSDRGSLCVSVSGLKLVPGDYSLRVKFLHCVSIDIT